MHFFTQTSDEYEVNRLLRSWSHVFSKLISLRKHRNSATHTAVRTVVRTHTCAWCCRAPWFGRSSSPKRSALYVEQRHRYGSVRFFAGFMLPRCLFCASFSIGTSCFPTVTSTAIVQQSIFIGICDVEARSTPCAQPRHTPGESMLFHWRVFSCGTVASIEPHSSRRGEDYGRAGTSLILLIF